MIKDTNNALNNDSFSFPGHWLGGISLIISPIFLLIGDLLKINFNYYFPHQLAAYTEYPLLMTTSYNFFIISFILMWPALLTLTRLIGAKKPGWAMWGGLLAMTGLFVWLFHEGVNYLAFQLVNVQGLETATKAIADSYTSWYVLYPLVFTDNLGWLVLAIGAYRSGTLGWFRSLALASMAAHYSGVLKGSDLYQVIFTSGLCIALVPLGTSILRNSPKPSRRIIQSFLAVVLLLAFIYVYTFLK